MDTTAVPITAWQQAAIVVLFIFLLTLVFAFVRWLLNWTRSIQAAAEEARRKAQEEWQAFVEKRDSLWQKWMDDQRGEDRQALCGVTDTLKDLAEMLRDHDNYVRDNVARKAGQPPQTNRNR